MMQFNNLLPTFAFLLHQAAASPTVSWYNPVGSHWTALMTWLEQPSVYHVIIAWSITFTVILTLLLCLGFGPAGIVTGSMAAAFQSWMYGGFTPAAGIFATLTYVGMVGYAVPVFAASAAVAASLVALVVLGVERGM